MGKKPEIDPDLPPVIDKAITVFETLVGKERRVDFRFEDIEAESPCRYCSEYTSNRMTMRRPGSLIQEMICPSCIRGIGSAAEDIDE